MIKTLLAASLLCAPLAADEPTVPLVVHLRPQGLERVENDYGRLGYYVLVVGPDGKAYRVAPSAVELTPWLLNQVREP